MATSACGCVCVPGMRAPVWVRCESESRSARGAEYVMSNGKAKPQEMQPRAPATGCDFDWQRLPLDTLAKQAVVRVVVVVVAVVVVSCRVVIVVAASFDKPKLR